MREIKVKIPTKDTDIKVGQYQEYIKLITSFKGEIVYNEFMKMKLVSIFCNVPFQLVKSGFTSADVDSISTKVLTVLDKVKKLEDANIEPIVKVGKTEFGFITDMEEMSAGTYADLTEVFGKWEEAHVLMAIVYRPVISKKRSLLLKIEQYEIAEYKGTDKYSEIMKQMPVIYLLQANFYLSNSFIKLRQIFLTYMEKIALDKMTQPGVMEKLRKLENSTV